MCLLFGSLHLSDTFVSLSILQKWSLWESGLLTVLLLSSFQSLPEWEWSLTDTSGLVFIILLMVSSGNAPCLKRASLITTCCNVAQLLRLVNWQTLPASVKMVLFTWSHCRFNYCPGLAFQGVGVFCDILKPCCVVFYEYAVVVFVSWLLVTCIRCFLSVSSLAKLIVAQS